LNAAYAGGAEAVRKATLENKLAELAKQGPASTTGSQAIVEANLQHEGEVRKAAAERLNVYSEQLKALQEQNAELNIMLANGATLADVERARRDIADAELKIMVQEQLAQRDAASGVRSCFLEMQEQVKATSQVVYDSLNSALDKTADNLTKLLTDQKTEWSKMFKDIGRDMLKTGIKSGLKGTLGAIGKHIPGMPKTSTLSMFGKSPATPWYVTVVGAPASAGTATTGAPATPGGGQPSGWRSLLSNIPIIGGLFKGSGSPAGAVSSSVSYGDPVSNPEELGGMLADGGDVTAGKSYLIGEQGPEILRAKSNANVMSNTALRQMGGGGGNTYTIDARGADLGAYNRIARGIEESSRRATATAVQATHERMKRTPQRKG
jgi:hypothetical protein